MRYGLKDNATCFVIFQPDKPTEPTPPVAVTDVTCDSLVLTWKPPKDDGGSKITHYVIEIINLTKGGDWMLMEDVKDTSYRVTKLIKKNEYQFRVKAVNKLGESPPTKSDVVIAKDAFGKDSIRKACLSNTRVNFHSLVIFLVWLQLYRKCMFVYQMNQENQGHQM